jgi:hypothetical protein
MLNALDCGIRSLVVGVVRAVAILAMVGLLAGCPGNTGYRGTGDGANNAPVVNGNGGDANGGDANGANGSDGGTGGNGGNGSPGADGAPGHRVSRCHLGGRRGQFRRKADRG